MLHKTNKKSYIYFTLIVSKVQQKAHTIVLSGENLFFFFFIWLDEIFLES